MNICDSGQIVLPPAPVLRYSYVAEVWTTPGVDKSRQKLQQKQGFFKSQVLQNSSQSADYFKLQQCAWDLLEVQQNHQDKGASVRAQDSLTY